MYHRLAEKRECPRRHAPRHQAPSAQIQIPARGRGRCNGHGHETMRALGRRQDVRIGANRG